MGALEGLPETFRELFGEADLVAGYMAYMALFMAFFAAIYAVLAIQTLRAEDQRAGRIGPCHSHQPYAMAGSQPGGDRRGSCG